MPKIHIKRMGIDPQASKQVPMLTDIENACSLPTTNLARFRNIEFGIIVISES
jgi:hypothetical protein